MSSVFARAIERAGSRRESRSIGVMFPMAHTGPRRGGQDQPDALLDLALSSHQRDASGLVGVQRKLPTGADELLCHRSQPPIRTVGQPMMIGAPHRATSPIRAAGIPPISTVGQPGGAIVLGGWTAGGGNEKMCGVPTVAAGTPPISTVGTPGGPITPGCPVGSPTRAAGGMSPPFS